MVGALTELGIPTEHVHYYSEGVRRGDVLVVVATTDEMAELAMTLLSHYQPLDLLKRAEEWWNGGVSRLDLHEEIQGQRFIPGVLHSRGTLGGPSGIWTLAGG